MHKYSYQGTQLALKLFSQVSGVFGILFFTTFALVILSGVLKVKEFSNSTTILNDPRVTLICLALWFLFVAWSLGMTFINFIPTIWMNDKGLLISAFIFFRVQILWSEIIDVGAGKPPNGYVLVRVRKITPFHRIYGWLYSRSFYPSFLIGKGITDRDYLIREIQQRIQRSTWQ